MCLQKRSMFKIIISPIKKMLAFKIIISLIKNVGVCSQDVLLFVVVTNPFGAESEEEGEEEENGGGGGGYRGDGGRIREPGVSSGYRVSPLRQPSPAHSASAERGGRSHDDSPRIQRAHGLLHYVHYIHMYVCIMFNVND